MRMRGSGAVGYTGAPKHTEELKDISVEDAECTTLYLTEIKETFIYYIIPTPPQSGKDGNLEVMRPAGDRGGGYGQPQGKP